MHDRNECFLMIQYWKVTILLNFSHPHKVFTNILSAWKIFRDVSGIDFVIQYFHYFFRELSMTEANTRKLITETGERIHAFNFIIFNNRPKKKKVKEPFLGNVENIL